jgi:hypothetical protein
MDMVVSKNKAKAESRSESAARHMEGKAEADARAMRMDGLVLSSRRFIGIEHQA